MGSDKLAQALTSRTRKLIGYQLLIGVVVALGFYLAQGWWQAQSALYGVFVNICMALLLGRSVARAGNAAHSAQTGMLILAAGGIFRFVLVLVLFGVGFKLLKLDPLAAIVGFGLAQMAYVIRVRESADN